MRKNNRVRCNCVLYLSWKKINGILCYLTYSPFYDLLVKILISAYIKKIYTSCVPFNFTVLRRRPASRILSFFFIFELHNTINIFPYIYWFTEYIKIIKWLSLIYICVNFMGKKCTHINISFWYTFVLRQI